MHKNYSEDCFKYNPNAKPQDYIDNSESMYKKKQKIKFKKITSEELSKRRIKSYEYII